MPSGLLPSPSTASIERRPVAPAGALGGVAHGGGDRQEVAAVDPHAGDAVGERADGDGLRGQQRRPTFRR